MANGRERERAATEVGGARPGFDVRDFGRLSQKCRMPWATPAATFDAKNISFPHPYGKRIMEPSGDGIQENDK